MQRTYGTGNPSVGLVSYINPVYNTSGFMIGYYYEIIDGYGITFNISIVT